MKYSIKAFSYTNSNGIQSMLLLFKGPFYYRLAGQKGKFVFPWQGKKIELTDLSNFPIVFIGIRGKRVFTNHEISTPVKWSPKNNWTEITYCELAQVNPENLIDTDTLDTTINQIKNVIEVHRIDFAEVKEPNVPIPLVDLSPLQEHTIPHHVYQLKNT